MAKNNNDELVFIPLGGLGEIGMNAALYGFGPKSRRKWILVDLGVAFAGPDLPGIELILPDVAFAESIRKDLLAIIITHAHEDHIGAIAHLWPRLGCPVYATRFAASLLETRRLSEPGAPDVPINIVSAGARIELGPFSVEYVPVAHSIPESCSLAIRTPAGLVVHTGDWKIDSGPVVGWGTDEARFRALGDEGVLALICDSTNIMREGFSPSEAEVAVKLRELVSSAPGRVLVTTFASNVARIRSVAEAAQAAGRSVVLVGRSMERVAEVARECGYLEGLQPFLGPDAFSRLPRDRIVVMATGSQGESRAAMARIALDEHPGVRLAPGDRVIFSSRPIPGNEKSINAILNGLARQGIEVITDRDGLVHASGHPRRDEVRHMYEWTRPRLAIPAHGEAMHIAHHAEFALSQGVGTVIKATNGDVVLLGPGQPAIVDEAPHGRLYTDGSLVVPSDDEALRQRTRLAFAGVISIGLALTSKGDLAGDPDVVIDGVPARIANGKAMDTIVDRAIFDTIDNLPRQRRRDADAVAESVEKAVRSAVRSVWGKRPVVHVLVMTV
jgi:ribonuclease J